MTFCIYKEVAYNIFLGGVNKVEVMKLNAVRNFIRMADDGWRQGWHERNGGNLTYRLKKEEVELIKDAVDYSGREMEIGLNVPGLAGEYFIVTGSGKYFRNVADRPEESIGIIRISDDGTKYRILWGLGNGARPTSELPTHLLNHEIKRKKSDEYRVVYHAHTTNVIALTFVLPLEDRVFTRELWEMATECPVVFPDGIGVVEWEVPGGSAIAEKTAVLMEKYDAVVWAHHGLFCAGGDFDETFGLMHTIEKSAEILVKVMSITGKKRQTITPQNFRDIAKDFNVNISEEFLYEK